jgi:hypothetical protein
MNPALLSALIRERESDMLRELSLAGALRQARSVRRGLRRKPAPLPPLVAARPRLTRLAGDAGRAAGDYGSGDYGSGDSGAGTCLPKPAA